MARPSTRWSWCSVHNKRGYHDQAAADDALRTLPDGKVMASYPCTETPTTLHVGHVHSRVVALEQLNKAGA